MGNLDYNLLKYLKLLLKEQNISNAARKAGISQPAMSKNLKKIRSILNDELLIQQNKKLVLTEKGESLKKEIDNVLEKIDNLMQPCSEFNPKIESGTIRIVSSDYASVIYLPKIIDKVKDYPSIKLEIYSPQEKDFKKLKEDEIDFYFGIGNISLLPEILIAKKVYEEDFISAVCGSHNLVNSKSIELDDYLKYPHMLISNLNLNTGKVNNNYNRGVVDLILDNKKLTREVSLVVPHFSVAPLMLKDNNYILTAPESIIHYYKDFVDMHLFQTPLKLPKSDFYIAWHQGSQTKRLNNWFKKYILDEIID